MQVVLPDRLLPARIALRSGARMSESQYWAFCAANQDLLIERTPAKEIVILPPIGLECAYRHTVVTTQLGMWSKKNRSGTTFGPASHYLLPSGAACSPSAAWVSNARIAKLTGKQWRRFLPFAPDFAMEVMSPHDKLPAAMRKLTSWTAEGSELAWLIDGDARTVYISRAGNPEPEKRTGVKRLAGEGPVAGFRLDLTEVWEGL